MIISKQDLLTIENETGSITLSGDEINDLWDYLKYIKLEDTDSLIQEASCCVPAWMPPKPEELDAAFKGMFEKWRDKVNEEKAKET